MSGGLRSPCHLPRSKSPDLTRSWAQSWPTAKRRTRPTPDRRRIPTAALLSAHTRSLVSTP
eukprot:6721057-Alexandrium_andersonii.AAC.1